MPVTTDNTSPSSAPQSGLVWEAQGNRIQFWVSPVVERASLDCGSGSQAAGCAAIDWLFAESRAVRNVCADGTDSVPPAEKVFAAAVFIRPGLSLKITVFRFPDLTGKSPQYF